MSLESKVAVVYGLVLVVGAVVIAFFLDFRESEVRGGVT